MHCSLHWQFIGNSLPKWALSDTVKIPYITLHLNKHIAVSYVKLKAHKKHLIRASAGKTLR